MYPETSRHVERSRAFGLKVTENLINGGRPPAAPGDAVTGSQQHTFIDECACAARE